VTYRLSLGNDSVNITAGANMRNNRTSTAGQRISKEAFSTIDRLCFLRGPRRRLIKGQRRSFELVIKSWESLVEEEFIWVSCQELDWRSGDGSLRWLRRNEKKWTRLWKEDFMAYVIRSYSETYKSVARIWLVKTENPTACVTANCKVCRSTVALYCL
jgi:hypothetical protein